MKRFKPLLIIFAFAGLFWACEATDPLVEDVQFFMITGDYDQAMEVVDAALAENENNYTAHYYKGEILSAKAEILQQISDRKELYAQARQSFDRSIALMDGLEDRPELYDDAKQSIVFYWAEEFNSGVNIINDDSLFAATPDPNFTAIAHLENATTMEPDSALPYQVMSSAYFNEQDIDNAVVSYEKAMSRLSPPEPEDYEYMIGILLVQENYSRAIAYTEEAREQYPDASIFVQLLADAYLQSDRQDEAIQLVEQLIADEPNNPQYRRVLGTQVYQIVTRLSDEATELYDEAFELRRSLNQLSGSERQNAQSRLDEIYVKVDELEVEMDELTEISTEQMKMVVELEPESESANFILGIIYQNRAASLFERRNNTEDNAEAQDYDQRARENLQEARHYYERAAELNPDNPENWESLFQVYTTLGMEEEALEALDRAGL